MDDRSRELKRRQRALDRLIPFSYHSKMTKATISSKGQIAIPKAVRERLNLKAGTEVVIHVQGEALVMKRLVRDFPDWRTMRGMFRGTNLLPDLAKEHASELARDDARINKGR